MSRRPLTLHVSALSDAEYTAYTEAFAELATEGKADWDRIVLSVREVRGWIRGRFGASVEGGLIDQILRLFCPELGPQDVLSGGQFFAVLRLIFHVQAGKKFEENLVFVQADPNVPPAGDASPSRPHSKSNPPPPPRPRPAASITPETTPAVTSPALPPRAPSTSNGSNPFLRSQSQPSGLPKASESPSNPFRVGLSPKAPAATLPVPSSSTSSTSSSPPKHATPPLPPRKPVLLPPPRHASLTRGPPAPPPLSSKASVFSTPPLPPPPAPPKPPKVTSPLIAQSLKAARGERTVKEVMESLGKERRAEVIKKSNGGIQSMTPTATAGRERSTSPPLSVFDVAQARIGSGMASPTRSVSTASSSASVSGTSEGRPRSMSKRVPPPVPPQPQHISTVTTTAQMPMSVSVFPATPSTSTPASARGPFSPSKPSSSPFNSLHNPRRTRSLHHPSPSTSNSPTGSPAGAAGTGTGTGPPPIPPPRRKRPESVQVVRSPFADTFSDPSAPSSPSASASDASPVERRRPLSASRHSSISIPHASSGAHAAFFAPTAPAPAVQSPNATHTSVMESLQRTLATLKPGPGFESARVKAEGKLLPHGYSARLARSSGRGGGMEGERLVDEAELGWDDDGGGGRGDFLAASAEGSPLGSRRSSAEFRRGEEFKMPVRPGEGWVALS